MTASSSDLIVQFDQGAKDLIALARDLIADDSISNPQQLGRSAERFVEAVSEYLDRFEHWSLLAERYNDGPDRKRLSEAEQQRIRKQVEELAGLHLEVIDLANRHKDDVAEKMGEVHKRAQGMKRYVDRLPQRITIAGKREG